MYKHATMPSPMTNYTRDELRARTESFFRYIGAPPRLKGREYIIRAVEEVYYDPDALRNIIAGLYPKIALENDTSIACVERDIRTFLKTLWRTGEMGRLYEHFSHGMQTTLATPTAKEFIALVASKLRRDPTLP